MPTCSGPSDTHGAAPRSPFLSIGRPGVGGCSDHDRQPRPRHGGGGLRHRAAVSRRGGRPMTMSSIPVAVAFVLAVLAVTAYLAAAVDALVGAQVAGRRIPAAPAGRGRASCRERVGQYV